MLRQFEYLVALARERHFGRAAEACHVTQPTLSAAIRQFEEELGAPIIERGHRYLGLTPQGKLALEHAQRVLAEVEELRRGVEALDHGLSGRLRLGVIPTALPIVSHLTTPFFARYPRVTVTVLSRTSIEIQRGIENFEIDAGVTYLDNEPLERVRARPIYQEEYLFLTPISGPYADRSTITWREAAEAPLCLLTPDMQNRRILDGVFRSVGATAKASVETNSIFNLVSHAASGPWSAIVPRQLLQFFGLPERTRALELVEPTARRSVGFIVADRDPPDPIARNLMDMPLPPDIVAAIVPMRKPGR
ncbi:MAG: LysR family transcriptional regulator [Pseudomonadota bacterium]|nr:LysR family transcriptional regulator [Pseudomonadota bacterium]